MSLPMHTICSCALLYILRVLDNDVVTIGFLACLDIGGKKKIHIFGHLIIKILCIYLARKLRRKTRFIALFQGVMN